MDLCDTQDNDGNTEVGEAKLIRIANQRFTHSYPEGLMKYLDHISDPYAGLDFLENKFTQNTEDAESVEQSAVHRCRELFD